MHVSQTFLIKKVTVTLEISDWPQMKVTPLILPVTCFVFFNFLFGLHELMFACNIYFHRCASFSCGSAPTRPPVKKRQHHHLDLQRHSYNHRPGAGTGAVATVANPGREEGTELRFRCYCARPPCRWHTQTGSCPHVRRCCGDLRQQ